MFWIKFTDKFADSCLTTVPSRISNCVQTPIFSLDQGMLFEFNLRDTCFVHQNTDNSFSF